LGHGSKHNELFRFVATVTRLQLKMGGPLFGVDYEDLFFDSLYFEIYALDDNDEDTGHSDKLDQNPCAS
jgi:hypothetical protein